jgi:alpha-tubulin suppressor-like RCC1 family protein
MSQSEWESIADTIGLEDEYEIIAELGRGGSAVVYRARDRALGRDVAIKVVRGRGLHVDAEQVARLAREARTVAQLDHPRIVTVYAVRPIPDGLALVMQWIPGRTLKQRIIEEGPLPIPLAMQLLRDVASALGAAHQRGIVHRDVKPENIFLDAQRDAAMLSDFGIAVSAEHDTRLTMTGTAIGTPTYMAPELLDGGQPTPRSDVFALGLVAWEMLTGRQPWAGETLYSVIYRQKHDLLPPIDSIREGVPDTLQYVVERALQKRPGARWAGGDGMLAQLDGSVLPADYPAWQAAHARRRAARAVAPADAAGAAPAVRNEAAEATRRFRRGDETLSAATATSAAAASTAAADVGADEVTGAADNDAPDWLIEAEAEAREEQNDEAVSRRVWPLAIGAAALIALAVGLSGGLTQWREATPPVTTSGIDSTASQVVPVFATGSVVTTVTTDSADANGEPIESDEQAGSLDDWPDVVDARPLTPPAARLPRPNTRVVAAPPTAAADAESAAARNEEATAVAGAPSVRVTVSSAGATLAAGGRHSCVVQRLRVWCWGANEDGQLGNGHADTEDRVVAVRGDLPFVSVSAGLAHSCGVVRGGAVYCWGSGEAGQLGDATTTSRTAPVRVASGLAFAVVRSGRDHSCALTVNGAVACWGRNHRGQLGDGTTVGRSSPILLQNPQAFTVLSVGAAHSCALSNDGAAYCWGANDAGQIGDGSSQHRATPTPVAAGVRFVSIATGSAHSCAVSLARDVWCWGRLAGVQRTTPTRVPGVTRAVSITAGTVHSCARSDVGMVWCWGGNEYGQLGTGTTNASSTPLAVGSDRRFDEVTASGAHTCALSGRDVWCWGYNADGQVGVERDGAGSPSGGSAAEPRSNETRATVLRPTRVQFITGGGW